MWPTSREQLGRFAHPNLAPVNPAAHSELKKTHSIPNNWSKIPIYRLHQTRIYSRKDNLARQPILLGPKRTKPTRSGRLLLSKPPLPSQLHLEETSTGSNPPTSSATRARYVLTTRHQLSALSCPHLHLSSEQWTTRRLRRRLYGAVRRHLQKSQVTSSSANIPTAPLQLHRPPMP